MVLRMGVETLTENHHGIPPHLLRHLISLESERLLLVCVSRLDLRQGPMKLLLHPIWPSFVFRLMHNIFGTKSLFTLDVDAGASFAVDDVLFLHFHIFGGKICDK